MRFTTGLINAELLINKYRHNHLIVIVCATSEFVRLLQNNTDDYSNIARHIHSFVLERIDSMRFLAVNKGIVILEFYN